VVLLKRLHSKKVSPENVSGYGYRKKLRGDDARRTLGLDAAMTRDLLSVVRRIHVQDPLLRSMLLPILILE
jgi:hypothetical protein